MAQYSDSILDAWKTFLRGRIAEEQGDRGAALAAYEKALEADPNNEAFQRARGNVLSAEGSPDQAAVARIARQYEHLAAQLTGPDDEPEAWIESLDRLLKAAESPEELNLAGQAGMVVW